MRLNFFKVIFILWWFIKNLTISFAASCCITVIGSFIEYYYTGVHSPVWLIVTCILWAIILGISLTLDYKDEMNLAKRVTDMANEEILFYIAIFVVFVLIILFIIGVVHGAHVVWNQWQTLF